jgi:ribosomal protein L16 Arg81 hydroxylase
VPETQWDLPKLLAPVDSALFFRDTWEKRPLTIARNDPTYFHSLFSLHDVDPIIAFTRPKFLEPADFKKGGPTAHSFVQGWLPDDQPLPVPFYPGLAEVHQAYQNGQTVIITAMQHRWSPVAALCRRLEEFFSCPVHTNMYLTPPGAQGFDAHFDTHEVFALQIEGVKLWRFYGSARQLPLAEERGTLRREQLPPPTLEVLLRPGDLLYMPRGHVHEAFTSDSQSLHLTVGVKVFRWADLLHQAVADLSARDVRFRESLPPGLLTGAGPAQVDQHIHELLQALIEKARPDVAVGRLAASFLGTLTALPGDYFTPMDADTVGLDTVLERTSGAICRVVGPEDGRTSLQFPGGSLDGPAKIASALQFIARTPRFVVRSLPDDLTNEAKLVLVRRLTRDRFLTVV